ncbi:hypothetical protein RND71_029014 [Anisodus tanguticus]|uniref:Mei2-like C-terminal RNA recognition motif domain-containing protein n=1 Tax=Anisodus tanguticus TaxID=243964 RepID=A0AAE1RM18_9SOLA|nr:hypothetical protein RND71_029014 [Anisodus tanguticus]
MASVAISAKKTLNPEAEEFKPTATENNLVHSLPHQIFHPPSYAPQGNKLVVYQPPPQGNELVVYHPQPQSNELVVYQPQPSQDFQPHQFYYYYYQENVGPHVKADPIYWIHAYYQPHDQQQLLDNKCEKKTPDQDQCYENDGIFRFGVKKGWMRASLRGQNKRPRLPPRLMRAPAAERGKQNVFFLRKPHQKAAHAGSNSSYTSPTTIKKDPSLIWSDKTTVMIRNIPNQFRTNNNMGYAFVNFTSGRAAFEIREVLKNFKWHGVMTPTGIYASRKICEVTWARIQGKEQLVKHFSGSIFLCDTDEYLPVVFSPPRNGSSRLTKPMTIGKLVANPAVSSSPLPDDE